MVLIHKSNNTIVNVNEKKVEICTQCKLNSKNLFVLTLDQKNLNDTISRFERSFFEIAQEAYLVFFKKIRARFVPNNDTKLLIRQQYKLAFISELRQDTHSALRF